MVTAMLMAISPTGFTSAPLAMSISTLAASPAVAASSSGDDSAEGCRLGLGFAPLSRSSFTTAELPGLRAAIMSGVRMSLDRALTSAPWLSSILVLSISVAAHISAVALASFLLLGSAPSFNRRSNVAALV